MKTQQTKFEQSIAGSNPETTVTEQHNDLQLTYQNEAENTIVVRTYNNHGQFVREVEQEYMYNYMEEQWESIHRFTYDYQLGDDEETLVGDGSNWRGTNRQWVDWFTQRHYERLPLRFPNDDVPESHDEHDPSQLPENIANEH